MIGHFSAALALILAQPAGPGRPCLQPSEVGDLAVVALPELIDSFSRTCTPHLPEGAFLRSGATAFSARLRTEGAAHQEPAFAAMKRMLPPVVQGANLQATLQAVIGGLTGTMRQKLDTKSCTELSRFTESLSPLPARNVAQMFSSGIGFGMAMRAPGRQGGPPICTS